MELSWVAQIGTVELAFGALTGWIMALVVDRPDIVKRGGVRSLARIRQAHIDYIIMGVILIALGLAVPGLPAAWQVLLVFGAWVNPTLFVPLAFRPEAKDELWYRTITAASFVAMSGATVAAAAVALGA